MLTTEQIQKIENLCNYEGVYFYDVRMEMIDHIAQGIEEKMQQNPQINFEAALKEIALIAGVYGFRKIVEERKKDVIKNIKRNAWNLFVEYLTVPKLIGSCFFCLVLASPKIFFSTSAKTSISMLMICLFLVLFWGLISSLKFKKPIEPLLALSSKNLFFWGFSTSHILISFSIFLKDYKNDAWFNTNWFVLLYAAITSLSILFAFAWFKTYEKLYNNMRKNYPLAFQK